MQVSVRRVYDPAEPADGRRILVDRVWPRGLSKDKAALDAWMRDVAPSSELRRWFNHLPERWEAFKERYRAELAAQPAALEALRGLASKQHVTLLFGARDAVHNQAVALKEILEST
ncbi:MAG: DUF488 domain-containing protein [Phreatobacter sp.]